jgi:hypothetical protein
MDIFYGACDRLIELTRARSQFIRETLQEKPEIYLWTPAYGQP